jgi:hypothetical protein
MVQIKSKLKKVLGGELLLVSLVLQHFSVKLVDLFSVKVQLV